MLSFLRGAYGRALTPSARLLLRLGLTPTQVTVAGTVAVVVAALATLPAGRFVVGSVLVCCFLLADGLDGTMARLGGGESRLGAFLDSTLDRIADAAVFASLAVWAAGRDAVALWLALGALVGGFLVSYARARAEAEGWDASVGLFERTDRLVVALAGTFAVGLGAPTAVLTVALGIVAAGSAVTVGQRITAAVRGAAGPSRPTPGQR
ncbi:phosphatidylinositol phosphate synthase [Tessaracoccus palaemonis]|uniref:Phosphatidylinositol phosphate synthase n=1 Tax=Tessaracoccus palaemonis TaxID=2829499 RepID=A0ABX8SHR3_9ACTN|nr:CDP-alcohol phosphatidyltransferase family protein [Tessaracoccus palaemonis]QXT62419.1 CDP-alcohol phosphatidyltransferase family protein [Tessaracoccus palaemonis]